jgi:hypothetical protein
MVVIMKTKLFVIILISFIIGLLSCQKKANNEKPYMEYYNSANDSMYTEMLMDYLRNHFDDIHDISMGFHHLDHTLNGIIEINMTWLEGRMIEWTIDKNETGSQEFANTLAQKIQTWYIPDLKGPFKMTLPLRIKIIGSDDPSFSQKGILTGEITDKNGMPVKYAKIHFESATNAADTLRNCYSNRDGIFVRTLIPVGGWNIECSAPGFKPVLLKNLKFNAGQHVRQKISLETIN